MNILIEKKIGIFSSLQFSFLCFHSGQLKFVVPSFLQHMSEASCVNLRERTTLSIAPRLCRNSLSRQWAQPGHNFYR